MPIPYACAILVSLIPDGNFIALTTTSRAYNRSSRFLLAWPALDVFVRNDEGHLYDADIENFICMYRVDENTVSVHISWLQGVGRDQLKGHKESFDLPLSVISAALNGQAVKHLEDNTRYQCHITLSSSAQQMIHSLNRLERSALRKALRDNWHWSHKEEVTLYADWNNSFFFRTDTICGGLCQHTDTITGRDGNPRQRIRYSIHT